MSKDDRRSASSLVRDRSRRAAATILALGVLAVLTILVMALAATQSYVRNADATDASRAEARRLARQGFETAALRVATGIDDAAGAAGAFETEGGMYSYDAAPARPDSTFGLDAAVPLYGGNYLKPRPGDFVVTIQARTDRGGRPLRLTQQYLVNLQPDAPRRLRLFEQIGTAAPAP